MNILLPNGKTIRGDTLVSNIIRSSLVPIPETVEAVIRYDATLLPYLKDGEVIKTGEGNTDYRIIWHQKGDTTQSTQGDRPYTFIKIIAVLDSVHKLSYASPRAVIKDSSTFGTIYRTCGATASIRADMTCGRIAVPAGQYATHQIMQLLQEESAAITWDGKSLEFIRNADLLKRTPVKRLESDTTQSLDSGFSERHSLPMYYSTNGGSGGLHAGDASKARSAKYHPRTDQRVLNNMTRVFLNKKLLDGSYYPSIRAGEVFEIAKKPYVVISAVHSYDASNQYSRFWLGDLS